MEFYIYTKHIIYFETVLIPSRHCLTTGWRGPDVIHVSCGTSSHCQKFHLAYKSTIKVSARYSYILNHIITHSRFIWMREIRDVRRRIRSSIRFGLGRGWLTWRRLRSVPRALRRTPHWMS